MKRNAVLIFFVSFLISGYNFESNYAVDENWLPNKIHVNSPKIRSSEALEAISEWGKITNNTILGDPVFSARESVYENGFSDFLGVMTASEYYTYTNGEWSLGSSKAIAPPEHDIGTSEFRGRTDVALNKIYSDSASSAFVRSTLVHEFGHSHGMSHKFKENSVMNYELVGDSDALTSQKNNIELWPYDVAYVRNKFPNQIKVNIDDLLVRNYYASETINGKWINVKHKNFSTGQISVNISADLGDLILVEYYQGSYSESTQRYDAKIILKKTSFERELGFFSKVMPKENSELATSAVTIPNIPVGTYDLWVELVNNGDLTPENNKTKVGTITLGGTDPSNPEYEVYNFYRSGEPIYASDNSGVNNFFSEFRVRNIGGSTGTIDDVAIAVIKNGTYVFDCWRKNSSTNIPSGSNYYSGVHWCEIPDAGTYSLQARLKVGGTWSNYKTMPSFDVIEPIGSQFSDLSFTSPIATLNHDVGDNFAAGIVVQNTGNTSSNSTAMNFGLSDVQSCDAGNRLGGYINVGTINAGGQTSILTITGLAEAAWNNKYLTAYVSPSSNESNTSNNCHVFGKFSIGSGTSGSPRIVFDSYNIDDDTGGGSNGNDNGIAEVGEEIELDVTLRNTGDADATNVSGVLTTNESCITITDSSESWGEIPAGQTDETRDFDFDVGSCANVTRVTFSLAITSDEGSWNDTFVITIEGQGSSDIDFYVQNPLAEENLNSILLGSEVHPFVDTCYTGDNPTSVAAGIGYYISNNQTFSSDDILLRESRLGWWSENSRCRNDTTRLTLDPDKVNAGSFYLLYVLDNIKEHSESNENNNIASLPITIINPDHDLYTTDAAITSGTSTLQTGDTLGVSVTERYIGNSPFRIYPTMGYYFSIDNQFDSSDDQLNTDSTSLGRGDFDDPETANLVIPSVTIFGRYYILFVSDFENEITETDENNNVQVMEIEIVESVSIDTDRDGIPDETDLDDDNDRLPDIFETVIGTNPLLVDTDGDRIDDRLDESPLVASNACSDVNVIFTNVVIDNVTCAAETSIVIDSPSEVQGGHLKLIAPLVEFKPGFNAGRLTVKSVNPCVGCIH